MDWQQRCGILLALAGPLFLFLRLALRAGFTAAAVAADEPLIGCTGQDMQELG